MPKTQMRKLPALTLRVVGRDLLIECRCGFMLTQPLRAAIAEQCPKCRRGWRR